jgi:hypothetical protein
MSNDGTPPPSIKPRRPATRAPKAGVRTAPKPVGASAMPTDGAERPSTTGEVKTTHPTGPTARPRPEPAALPRPERPGVPQKPTPKKFTETGEQKVVSAAPRKVRLAVARIDPWSVMKLSFLVSVGIGIMIVVASAVVWITLDGLGVFASIHSTITEVTGDPDFFNIQEYLAFDRVISVATMIAVVDIVILTALATIGAFLYNIVAALVGGIHMTLTDD